MTTTVNTLTHLDRKRIRSEETAAVRQELDACVDAASRLKATVRITDEAVNVLDRLRPVRDRAAVSLAVYDGARGLSRVLGTTRTRFYDIRLNALGLTEQDKADGWLWHATPEEVSRRAEEMGVPRVPDAALTVCQLAEEVARAEARDAAAQEERNRLVSELLEQGWRRKDVAELIGRNPSRVSHIKAAAARRKAGGS